MQLKTEKNCKSDEMAQLRFSKLASHFGSICICKQSSISLNFGKIIRMQLKSIQKVTKIF